METPTLTEDVDRALAIYRQIEELEAELEPIQERIEAAAEAGVHIPLEDPERDGMQFLAYGTEQLIPVVLTADCLKQSFARNSADHLRIRKAAGDKFSSFFAPKHGYETRFKDGKQFRKAAREILGEEAAVGFISQVVARNKAGIPKSATKVEFNRARPIALEVAKAA